MHTILVNCSKNEHGSYVDTSKPVIKPLDFCSPMVHLKVLMTSSIA